MILKIEIELGNDEMQTWGNVRNALRDAFMPVRLARVVHNVNRPYRNDSAKIMDVNGNTVGDWRVSE